jgi:hypothetical protein
VTLPADRPHGSSHKQSEKPAYRLANLIERLDDAIVAVSQAFWRAVIEGFAVYGMSVCAPLSDLEPSRTTDGHGEREGKPVMHSWSELYSDDCVFEEYDDIDSLIRSLRLWDGEARR